MTAPSSPSALDRRTFMGSLAGFGLAGTAFADALWTRAQQAGKITPAMIEDAGEIAGLEFDPDEREMMVDGLNRNLRAYSRLRSIPVPNSVGPAVFFDPLLPGRELPTEDREIRYTRPTGITRPADLDALAFAPLTDLAELIRTRRVSSIELTTMYLDRLKRHGPRLECTVTLTEDLAMRQARRADADLARGLYRGPLHGIPWGAKDLLAEDEYPTTWGAAPYREQVVTEDATVTRRLEDAGAVLIAKLTLGALAMGDVWFGGKTRNPWNLEQGSSGSSAGPAAATVAGLVGFSIGSETLGSIVSPSTRCGASGLRPTFGRVSRSGAMALSWSMDKLGPLCRYAEDCALVLDAIHGADGRDPTARTVPFNWDAGRPLDELRLGYFKAGFESPLPDIQNAERRRRFEEAREFDLAALKQMRDLGVDLIPVEPPTNDEVPVDALRIILSAEAAAAFDDLTRSGRDAELVRQDRGAWPNAFRTARMIPAVEYLQANRVRTMVMGLMEARLEGIDAFITPSFGGNILLLTNLTGHPTVVVPSGFRPNGTPVSISFIGKLYGDAEALTMARAFQAATDYAGRRPPGF